MVKFLLGLYTIILLILSPQLTLAATPPKFGRGQLKGQLTTEYYTTDANYDRLGGSFEGLANDNQFSYISVRPRLTYGLNRQWGLSGGFNYAYGESEGAFFDSQVGGLNSINRSQGGLTDLETSLYYKAVTRSFYLLPQIKASVPIMTFDAEADDALINEGATRIELGAWIEKKFLGHRFYAYAAYAFQGDGRAHLIPFELGLYNNIGGFLYGGSIWGNEIASDDEFINSPEQRSNRTDQLNAGSLRFYAVNPKVINAKAWVGTRIFKDLLFYLNYEKSINGSNFANGQSIILQLKWRILNPKRFRRRPKKERFKPDGVNEQEEKLLNNSDELSRPGL